MTGAEVLDLAREAVWTMILVAGPTMIIGLFVIIALFQALTQIQEMTLVFVPKILAIFVTILVTLPFMSQLLQSFMGRVAEMILTTG
ncbi:MAG: flagellar biosynthetic protein FliQ [Roseibium sp.]|nr:flagellar biosynthetic protein FliQ [Roseibium sp.]